MFYLLRSKSKVNDSGDIFINLNKISAFCINIKNKNGKKFYIVKFFLSGGDGFVASFDKKEDLLACIHDAIKNKVSSEDLEKYFVKLEYEYEHESKSTQDETDKKMREVLEKIFG